MWKDMGLQKRITEKEREPDPAPDMWPYYVMLSIKNLPTMKKQKKEKNDAMIKEYQ